MFFLVIHFGQLFLSKSNCCYTLTALSQTPPAPPHPLIPQRNRTSHNYDV